jgi:fumarate reductase subunit C
LRELSSVFVAWFVVLSLLLLRALSQGPDTYARFQEWLKEPLLITLNAVSLIFVLFHTVTWFNAAPRAMAVRVKGRRVPDALVAGFHYLAWLVISGVVAWLVLRK